VRVSSSNESRRSFEGAPGWILEYPSGRPIGPPASYEIRERFERSGRMPFDYRLSGMCMKVTVGEKRS
jgi:hypothetical protein